MIPVPPETPVTNPLLSTVAMEGVNEVHATEDAAAGVPLNCVVEPAQIARLPVMDGAFTVTVTDTVQPVLFV